MRSTRTETVLDTYLREINEIPLLRADEEKALALRVEAGDLEARDRMVRANLRLVVSIARRFNNRGLSFQDLISEGNIGLMRAVDGFDPSMNTRFSTYATLWIKQSIRRGLHNTARTIRLPSHMVEMLTKWGWTSTNMQRELGRTPTDEEVAQRLGLSQKQLGMVRQSLRAQNTSMQSDAPAEGLRLDDVIEDRQAISPSARLDAEDEWQLVAARLGKLEEREARVLRMRFGLDGGEPKTLKEVGKHFALTRERVRQIEHAALRRLRSELSA